MRNKHTLRSIIRYFKIIFLNQSRENKSLGYIKFTKGEEVKVTIYSEIPEFWYIGKVLDINARYIIPSIESSWRVEYYVSFKNSKGSVLKYWFLESELKKYCLQDERNSIIDNILDNDN